MLLKAALIRSGFAGELHPDDERSTFLDNLFNINILLRPIYTKKLIPQYLLPHQSVKSSTAQINPKLHVAYSKPLQTLRAYTFYPPYTIKVYTLLPPTCISTFYSSPPLQLNIIFWSKK